MNFNDFVNHAEARRHSHPDERIGQRYFNALSEISPELADEIRNGPNDPFHMDQKLPAFCEEVAQMLYEGD